METRQPHSTKNASLKERIGYALNGLVSAWKRESSFRFQVGCTIALVIFCAVIRPPALWCALFAICAALVLALELMNSALEALLDRLHPETHSEIGFVKDCLAGAVLVVSIGSVLVFLAFVVSTSF